MFEGNESSNRSLGEGGGFDVSIWMFSLVMMDVKERIEVFGVERKRLVYRTREEEATATRRETTRRRGDSNRAVVGNR